METIKKIWGQERVVVNNENYCGKFLDITPGYQCSLHYHIKKRETFYVMEGVVSLQLILPITNESPANLTLILNSSSPPITIEPGVGHRFWCGEEPAVILEISMPHSDDDVVRIEDSRAI